MDTSTTDLVPQNSYRKGCMESKQQQVRTWKPSQRPVEAEENQENVCGGDREQGMPDEY
jgi:hypothetical protein